MAKSVLYSEPKEISKVPLLPLRNCKVEWIVSVGGRGEDRREVNAVSEDISWPAAWRSERRPAAKCTPVSTSMLL